MLRDPALGMQHICALELADKPGHERYRRYLLGFRGIDVALAAPGREPKIAVYKMLDPVLDPVPLRFISFIEPPQGTVFGSIWFVELLRGILQTGLLPHECLTIAQPFADSDDDWKARGR